MFQKLKAAFKTAEATLKQPQQLMEATLPML
jgi:hypothetical protein